MTVDKLTLPSKENAVQEKINEIIDNLGISSGANTDLSNLSSTGEAHFQAPLVSGTNIKTINNTSILGSGNIDTKEIFIAEYGVTSFSDIEVADNAGKTIFCRKRGNLSCLSYIDDTIAEFSACDSLSMEIKTYYVDDNDNWDSGIQEVVDTDLSNLTVTGQNIADTVKDQNTSSRLKYWTGTQAEYDTLVNNNEIDADTLYNITDNTSIPISILEALYPVGAIYIGTMNACPLATLGVGTWQLVAQDRVLQGAGTRGAVGTTINESLPDIRATVGIASFIKTASTSTTTGIRKSGAFNDTSGDQVNADAASATSSWFTRGTLDFIASISSAVYQNGAPVQQNGYLVNIWERVS